VKLLIITDLLSLHFNELAILHYSGHVPSVIIRGMGTFEMYLSVFGKGTNARFEQFNRISEPNCSSQFFGCLEVW